MIKRNLCLLLSGVAVILTSCGGDIKAANEVNFQNALNAHYAEFKECLNVGRKPNSVGIIGEIQQREKGKSKEALFFHGLEELGLLESVAYPKESRNWGKITVTNYIGYKFTDEGKAFLRPAELDVGFFSTGNPKLCYATREVVEVTSFTEPADFNGVKASSVKYTYKLTDVAPWVNSPVIAIKFRRLPNDLASESLDSDDELVLTNNGWVHHTQLEK